MSYQDARGCVLSVGQKVAFNYSGMVAVGFIETIGVWTNRVLGKVREFPLFTVHRTHPTEGTSYLRSHKTLLVIHEERECAKRKTG